MDIGPIAQLSEQGIDALAINLLGLEGWVFRALSIAG